jgi:G:T-mismatch repair DNA endonuclease (very short patch repair protein)
VLRPYVITDAARVAWRAGSVKTHAIRRAKDNYGHSDETRAKMSVATTRAIAEGRKSVVSQLEHEVAAELDRIGVRHVRQFGFRGDRGRFAFVVDFWLPDVPGVIEVNGTYWHADPRVYPGPLNATQRHNVGRYRRKVEYLNSIGIRVAEVWEQDFRRDPRKAVFDACQDLARR